MGSMFIIHASITEYRTLRFGLLSSCSTCRDGEDLGRPSRLLDASADTPTRVPLFAVIIFGTAVGTEGHTGRHT